VVSDNPLSTWICDGLQTRRPSDAPPSRAARLDEPPPPPAIADEPTAGPQSGVRLCRDAAPASTAARGTLPASYRASRSSGARVMLGITTNPWKARG
jgi:hypothetical protein